MKQKKETLNEWWNKRTKNQRILLIVGVIIFIALLSGLNNNSEPKKSRTNKSSSYSTHTCPKCGNSEWDGKTYFNQGRWGKYCNEMCYVKNYPN